MPISPNLREVLHKPSFCFLQWDLLFIMASEQFSLTCWEAEEGATQRAAAAHRAHAAGRTQQRAARRAAAQQQAADHT